MPQLGGRYLLVELLGRGGMSEVWRGYDEVLGRSVAVKLLGSRYAADAASRDRIRAEARVASRLSHPYICRVFDYGEATDASGEQLPYLVMELLPGSTLADQLRAGPMPVPAALRLGAQVASALAAAHDRGLVHRDVKPGNIMLTAAGPKVVDFGIAAAAGEAGEPRSDGEVWGTPAYVAPERLTGGEVVPATDVYALGLVLYRALAGRPPWQATTVPDMLRAHQELDPAPLPQLDGLPAAVADLCERSLAKEPGQRPSAQEMGGCLAEAGGWRLSAPAGGVLIGPEDLPVRSPVGALVLAGSLELAGSTDASGPTEVAGAAGVGRSPVAAGPRAVSLPATLQLRPSRLRALAATAAAAVVVGPLGGLWLLGGPSDRYLGVEVVTPATEAPAEPSTAVPSGRVPVQLGPGSRADPGALPTPGDAGGGGGDPVDAGGATQSGGAGGAGPADTAPAITDPPSTNPSPAGSPESGSGTGSSGTDSDGGSSGGTPTPSLDPEPVVRVLNAVVATLEVSCVGSTATLLEHEVLLVGATLGSVDSGPGASVGITLVDLLGVQISVDAGCRDGVPVLLS